jgi:PAS domain S-box-containing protein
VAALCQENPQVFEWQGNKLDGTPIETEVTLTTFILDGNLCKLSLIRDITQRKQLEEALRDSEVRYRTLFENAGDAISINKDSRTIDCNKRLAELYGLTRDEILSATLGEFFPVTQPTGRDSREYFREKVEASHSGIPQVYEWHGRKRDGTSIITEVNLTTFKLGDEIYEQAIARDITQRKQMEAKLLDLNKTLEDRVVQRTDELEKACAELLDRNVQYRALAAKLTAAEEEERRRIARLLHDSCQQLLVAAKFKAEMLQSGFYGHDVSAMGQQILEILEQALADTRSLTMELAPPILYGSGFVAAMQWLAGWMEEKHHLQVSVVGSLPVIPVPADVSNLLFRAVRELLFNVIKHSGVKQAQVKIVAFNQGLRVSVIDEGCGFKIADVLQSPRSYGLFSIQEQLTVLDGRLDISSAPLRGTLCTLSVPLADPGVSPAFPDLSGSTPVESYVQQPPRYIRIVVADDHAGARDGLVQVLGLAGDFVVVGEAVDGLDAIEKAGQLRPDVVLMDMTMPRLNGLAATQRITSEFPGVKVIGLSMHAREDVQTEWLEAGALCYLQKSTPVEELIIAIRAAVPRLQAELP